MWKKKPVIFKTGNVFCFKSNVSIVYNNDVIIYKKKNIYKKKSREQFSFVSEFSSISYYNIGKILKLVHKKILQKHRPVASASNNGL